MGVQTERDPQTVGELIRFWRTQRRLTQMELALEANLSTKHLSFVETGRSRPSRQLLVHLAQHLDLPIGERNRLLLAGGFAPPYLEQAYDGEMMRPLRESLSRLLEAHEPNPALIVDGLWNLIEANQAASLLWDGVDPELLDPPINMLRLAVHPGGLPKISSVTAACNAPLITKLRRRSREDADPALGELIDDVESYLPDDLPTSTATPAGGPAGPAHTTRRGQSLHRDRHPRGATGGDGGKPRDRDLPADGRAQRSAAWRAQCKGARRMTALPPRQP